MKKMNDINICSVKLEPFKDFIIFPHKDRERERVHHTDFRCRTITGTRVERGGGDIGRFKDDRLVGR